ncbi:MAG: 1-deoxy-D-xylulose-5-phosphate reductoisomerase [Candidatus Omnitrophota bacterium]
MKKIAILGSTGSIGKSVLSVIEHFPDDFSVVGLTAASNINLLAAQIRKFKPRVAACLHRDLGKKLKSQVSSKTKIFFGEESLNLVATLKEADLILIAISGFSALYPLLAAIQAGKHIALANKEALVSAGSLISKEIIKHKTTLIPIDSEQCAIFQCLAKEPAKKFVKTIYLTASGGPLYFKKDRNFNKISKEEVLRHPRWSMGKKITVDSATLMNKGLEVIEAKWLFAINPDQIKVLIHPQAIVHSMVEFIDGSILAQLSITDMKLPIQFALSYPNRISSPFASLDFRKFGTLNFFEPDNKRFPCLSLAYRALKSKPSATTVLNAANEEAVTAFLTNRLKFSDIAKVVEETLGRHKPIDYLSLKNIVEIDFWARAKSKEFIERI